MDHGIFVWFYLLGIHWVTAIGPRFSVSSPEDSVVHAMNGFGTDLECFVDSCVPPGGKKVQWYRDNHLIAEGTSVLDDTGRMAVRHSVDVEKKKTCQGKCSSTSSCAAGFSCVDNACCVCKKEEFTLLLYNLTISDTGTYQCRLDEDNAVEFQLNVVDGGLSPTFSENITFDYEECCRKNGISDRCLGMCKPQSLESHKFDPIPCHKEFGKLLQCATHNGSTSHVHCCRLQLVPQFCWEYCSSTENVFEPSNNLCLYWMPEIFQCYEQAYLPLPGYPEKLSVDILNSSSVHACWDPPHVRPETITYYVLRYQELPQLPFFGGLFGGDEDYEDQDFDGSPPLDHDHEEYSHEYDPGPATAKNNRPYPNVGPRRRKRQSLVITTHNFDTNESDVREYRPVEINTTDTCVLIDGLKPSTHYTLYVKAVNSFGIGLPSPRATVETPNVNTSNTTLPDVQQCCSDRGVDEDCATKLCDVTQPPGTFNAFSIALTCRSEFPNVAPCLADGRDHTQCCRAKNVGSECLKLCNGSAPGMSASSVLCLSLDMTSIYGCLIQGYETHPSPPTNVTVSRITSTSAMITWNAPKDNGEKVISYSLHYRGGISGEYTEVYNVTSPFELDDLEPDSLYSVHVVAYTPQGKSLKSTAVSFFAGEQPTDGICAYGQPLLDEYGAPVICGLDKCPEFFECVDSENDDTDASYCCPTRPLVEPTDHRPYELNYTACCVQAGVNEKCARLCSLETTKEDILKQGEQCKAYMETWLDCIGGERDNRPCCREHVPEQCMDLCYSEQEPIHLVGIDRGHCVDYVQNISRCAALGIRTLPGPPRFVRHLVEGPTWVSIRWDEPFDTILIDHYEVHFNDGSKESILNSSSLSIVIDDLKEGNDYSVKVRSMNSRGSSVFTPTLNFTLINEERISVENEKGFPSQPSELDVVWYRDRKANLTWTWDQETFSTGKAIKNYEFNVSYGESLANGSRVQWKSVITKENSVVLDNLKENASYDAFVTARDLDSNISGIPGPIVTFRASTAKSPPWAEMDTIPEGPFHVGDRIEVSCTGGGDPVPNVTIEGFGRLLARDVGMANAYFEIATVDDANEQIICSADNGHFVPFRETYTLKVLHPPQVYPYTDPVHVIQDTAALLSCRIRSYPTAEVTWYYQNQNASKRAPKELYTNEKYDAGIVINEISNSFNATLTVNQAEPKDAGDYYCKACNNLGCTNTSQRLVVDSYPVPPGPDYILDCCKSQNVRSECLSACTVDIDIAVYETNTHCVNEFPKLMFCSKDGIDHSECCSRSGVPDRCLSYCNRRLTSQETPSIHLDSCGGYTSDIISCVESGHQLVPPTPINVRVRIVTPHSFNITWDTFDREDGNVPLYVVYYKRRGEQHYTMARTEKMWTIVKNVHVDDEYNVTVIAANRHGFSMFAPILAVARRSDGLIMTIHRARSTAGTVLAVMFFLFVFCVLIGVGIYFTRRPKTLSDLLQKLRGNNWLRSNGRDGAVAFENPGYDKEAQVHVLPPNGPDPTSPVSDTGPAPVGNSTWERAELEPTEETVSQTQKGMRYTQFS